MVKKAFYIILLAALSFSFSAGANDIITWYKLDQPPYYIVSDKEKGIHDHIIDYLISRLPEYDNTFIRSNVKRALKEIEKKKPAVFLGIYKNAERQEYTLYPDIPLYLNLITEWWILKA